LQWADIYIGIEDEPADVRPIRCSRRRLHIALDSADQFQRQSGSRADLTIHMRYLDMLNQSLESRRANARIQFIVGLLEYSQAWNPEMEVGATLVRLERYAAPHLSARQEHLSLQDVTR